MKTSTTSRSAAVLSIALVLVAQLTASTQAFVPARRPTLRQVTRSATSTLSNHHNRPTTHLLSTLSDKDTDQKLPFSLNDANHEEEGDKNCLELDASGRLRLCKSPDVLFQGLDPEVWSATRPNSGKTNSLFLHTNHPESLPEHQTSLGSLISCRRLIACARKYSYWRYDCVACFGSCRPMTFSLTRCWLLSRTKPLLDGPQNRSQRQGHSL